MRDAARYRASENELDESEWAMRRAAIKGTER
jgi:hypothetical protein